MLSESQVIDVFSALAQATRLKIVRTLVMAGPDGLTAGQLAEAAGVSPSNLSFHLRQLERANLIAPHRQQRSIFYGCVYETLAGMQTYVMENCCSGTPRVARKSTAKVANKNGGR